MKRPILACAFLMFASAAFAQQQSSPSDPYEGQSKPPADDTIVATQPDQPKPKPAAGKPLVQPQQAPTTQMQPAAPVAGQADAAAHPTSIDPAVNFPESDVNGTDEGIVRIAPAQPAPAAAPVLSARTDSYNPDGDIVHPHPLRPGELADGTTIRVRLITPLSTTDSQRGEEFRTRVASDVLQDGQVLIPAGAEIDGRVVEVSSGTVGGRGSLRLRPETVILLDGSRFHMSAQVTGTPGTNTRIGREGSIEGGSRFRKAGIEYGGGVGGGAAAGAMIGGPVGALAGSIVGAGVITTHLLVDHPQAVLEPGTVLLFTTIDRIDLQATNSVGN